jgi:hypothetical protein
MGRVTRSTVPLDGVKHGTPGGYDNGCGCFPCRAANKDRVNKYRAKKEQNGGKPLSTSAKVPHDAGLFEADIIRFLAHINAEGDEAKLIGDLMVFNAKLLDSIPSTERWHLSNGTQKTLLDLKAQLTKLKAEQGGGDKPAPDPANDLAGFLGGLTTQG